MKKILSFLLLISVLSPFAVFAADQTVTTVQKNGDTVKGDTTITTVYKDVGSVPATTANPKGASSILTTYQTPDPNGMNFAKQSVFNPTTGALTKTTNFTVAQKTMDTYVYPSNGGPVKQTTAPWDGDLSKVQDVLNNPATQTAQPGNQNSGNPTSLIPNATNPTNTKCTEDFYDADPACYTQLAPITLPGGGGVDTSSLPAYLQGIYKIGIGLCFALGVIMFVWAGIEYILTEAVASKGDAKKRMTSALIGLAIALVSFLLLQTINPNLLVLKDLKDVINSKAANKTP